MLLDAWCATRAAATQVTARLARSLDQPEPTTCRLCGLCPVADTIHVMLLMLPPCRLLLCCPADRHLAHGVRCVADWPACDVQPAGGLGHV